MDVQQIISLLIVASAGAHLLWYVLHKIKRSREGDFCGGCGSCGKPTPSESNVRSAPQATPLITLSAPPRRGRSSTGTPS
ncbi:MAG: hypothetical protein WCP07_02800 [bacterium]